MRLHSILVLLTFLNLSAIGQIINGRTIDHNGNTLKHVNIAIIGESGGTTSTKEV